MERTKLLLCIFFSAAVVLIACSKGGNGYFGRPLNTPSSPPPVAAGVAPVGQYIYYFNIFIDSNSTYTFKLPLLTQGVLDSGTFNITFKSNLVVEDVWFPLPEFIFTNGATVFIYETSVAPGAVTLRNYVNTTPAMDYCFYISTSH
jgi:hypothetical protein